MLTKKHFEQLATILADAEPNPGLDDAEVRGADEARRYIGERLADLCAADNPNFDRARFWDACNLP